ncbi:hypothetical protein ACL02R_11630 [Streptomyces sp. MS19]|uniref:hypothetical protein n=1 Tax=Streptomyces sp. MS19 TaxID=3385972 RepID=UPI0039A01C01
MTSSKALALFDLAASLDRIRFQVQSLPRSEDAHVLVDLTASMRILLHTFETAIDNSHTRGSSSKDAHHAALAFAEILMPLGEVLAHLGRVQEQLVALTAPGFPDMGSVAEDFRRHARTVIDDEIEAAEEALDAAAGELRVTATHLAQPRTVGLTNHPRASQTEVAAPPPTAPSSASSNRT